MDVYKEVIPVFSAITALLAVFFGPMVTLKVAKKTIISPMRQAWINSLRDLIACFLAISERSEFKYYKSTEADETKKKERQKIYERLVHLESKISLMINSQENDHIRLLSEIKAMKVWTYDEESSFEEMNMLTSGELTNFDKKHQAITKISRTILKKEWEVVKNG
ncbi:MAG: hypothetical protein ACOYL3_13750 [Desulfuromonadaceae bacterium]